jgi:hypothetical protein
MIEPLLSRPLGSCGQTVAATSMAFPAPAVSSDTRSGQHERSTVLVDPTTRIAKLPGEPARDVLN